VSAVHTLTTDLPSWDEVLAAVEADVERSEQMLTAIGAAPGGLAMGQLSPAELMLPAAGPMLPNPAVMPRVPNELAERIHALRDRIAELSREMSATLDEVGGLLATPAATELAVRPPAPAPRPQFVDRSF
jgi:hypothetical protein